MGGESRWSIYTKEGYQTIDSELEQQFEKSMRAAREAISSGVNPLDAAVNARDSMYAFMDTFEGYGTRDTEPETILVTRICHELQLDLEALPR